MTEATDVFDVKAKLEAAGIETVTADSPMVAENLVSVTDLKDARAIMRIMEALEDNDDIQDVFSNFDISDDLMEEAAAE
jgi:transcriptional/translational regulatory protein YebC/TACO1